MGEKIIQYLFTVLLVFLLLIFTSIVTLSSTNEFNPSRPDPERREKINVSFYFCIVCGPSKGFIKALKAFTKPLEAPQRSVKIKI